MIEKRLIGKINIFIISTLMCICCFICTSYADYNKFPNPNSMTNNKDKNKDELNKKYEDNYNNANPNSNSNSNSNASTYPSFPSWSQIENSYNNLLEQWNNIKNSNNDSNQNNDTTSNNDAVTYDRVSNIQQSTPSQSKSNGETTLDANKKLASQNTTNKETTNEVVATTNPQLYTTTQEDIEDSQSDLEENNNEGEVVESVLTGSANEESVSVDNAQVINTDESSKNTKYIVWGIVLIIGAIAVVLFTRRAKKSDKTLLNNMIMKAPDGKKIKNKKDETVVANGAVKNNNFYNVDEEKKKIEIKNNDKVSTATPKNVASEKSEIKQKKKVTKLEPIIFKKKEKKMEDFEIEVS